MISATMLLTPVAVFAQASQCQLPRTIQSPRPISPRSGEARPNIPVGGYTLALSWSPEHCAAQYNPRNNSQCNGSIGSFGFILHGLWAEGSGRIWPQYCRAAPIVPREVIAANLCMMPSTQLMQHQWAKHGTCVAATPRAYFDRSRQLFQTVRFPDMATLSKDKGLTVGKLISVFAVINPGMKPDMLRVRSTYDGWLDEVWICLDRRFIMTRCPASKGGLRPSSPLRIRNDH
jgi:ribonuclease T2